MLAGNLASPWKERAMREWCPFVHFISVPRLAGHESSRVFLLVEHQLLISIAKSVQPPMAAFIFGARGS